MIRLSFVEVNPQGWDKVSPSVSPRRDDVPSGCILAMPIIIIPHNIWYQEGTDTLVPAGRFDQSQGLWSSLIWLGSGTPGEDFRHMVFDAGHWIGPCCMLNWQSIIVKGVWSFNAFKSMFGLDWLSSDSPIRHLGNVILGLRRQSSPCFEKIDESTYSNLCIKWMENQRTPVCTPDLKSEMVKLL